MQLSPLFRQKFHNRHADDRRFRVQGYFNLQHSRVSPQIYAPPVRKHTLIARRVTITPATSSTDAINSGEEKVDALRQAADGLIHTSEKYHAALKSASKADRALDAEWQALSHYPHPVGVEDVQTEVPSVGDFCETTLKDYRCELTPSLTLEISYTTISQRLHPRFTTIYVLYHRLIRYCVFRSPGNR